MVDGYFERVGYDGSLSTTFESLEKLHQAHVFNIPFENLDVFYGRAILLDTESLYKKLVESKRGGYCFEMNGLFSHILKQLGFEVEDLLARVAHPGGYSGKLHQVLKVKAEDKFYLCDVGFGNDGLKSPIEMEPNIEQNVFSDTYRLMPNRDYGLILEQKKEEGFSAMYAISLEKTEPVDFEVSSHFTSTHPQSRFKSMPFITMPTKVGRISLTGNHLKIVENGQATEREIDFDSEFAPLLSERFGLNLEEIIKGDK